MSPSSYCRHCGSPLDSTDRFCGVCGTPVQAEEGPRPASNRTAEVTSIVCSLCGQRNSANLSSCTACGAALTHSSQEPGKTGQSKGKGSGVRPARGVSSPLGFLQSWKLTVTLAAALVVTVILLTRSGGEKSADASLSPQAAVAIREIEALQKTVADNPDDAQAELRLANLYHDSKMYSKAVVMYDRYLQLHPTDPDARVDMGICYFEMSFTDTAQSGQYLETAMQEIKKALGYQPKHQLACFNLGIISFHTGDTEQAYSWLRRCVEIDSTTEVGRRARQFLTQHSLTNRPTS